MRRNESNSGGKWGNGISQWQVQPEKDVLKVSDEWLTMTKSKDISIFYTTGKQLLNVDEVDRGIEKTQFSRILDRHKIISESEDSECWEGHLIPVKVWKKSVKNRKEWWPRGDDHWREAGRMFGKLF